MKCFLLLFIILFIESNQKIQAQYSRYIIRLKDKTDSPFSINNPSIFLTDRAIERRVKYNIAIDNTDLPINPAHIEAIRSAGNVTILNVSKWFNQVCIKTTDAAALATINALPFVLATNPIAARPAMPLQPINKLLDPLDTYLPSPIARPPQPADFFSYGQSYNQIHLHNTDFLHNLGFRGEGLQLAMMDAGYMNYLTLPTFDSVRNNHQILGTWDFVASNSSVNEDNPHGMACFSTIAANMPGVFTGSAPKTSFYLFRTEDAASEYPVEEQNFVAAAEKADSLGVDVFSVSLGYNYFDYSNFNYVYADMNGHTSLISKASTVAARKGIAVVVAAGNDGNSAWHYITTPADADSVLAVGAVNANRQPAGFSSYGPSSDGRIKPDVAAVGAGAIVANQTNGQPSFNNGTSFATPIMAGVLTCLWQAFPEVDNIQLEDALRLSADRFSIPDNRTGYGIPDVKKAFVLLVKKLHTANIAINNHCSTEIKWTVKAAAGMNFTVERKLPFSPIYTIIATQPATGNFSSQHFLLNDDLTALPAGATIRYRIKMKVADTSFYIDSALVNYILPCTITENKIIIGPNPVTDNLTVSVIRLQPAMVSILVHSASGQQVYHLNNQQINTAQSFIIPLKQMSRGIYYVSVWIDNKKTITKKIARE